MSLSRKHYVEIAKVLNVVLPNMPSDSFVLLSLKLMDVFQEDNPRFDRERFLSAVYKPREEVGKL